MPIFIYALIDPNTDEIRYIGKTEQKVAYRRQQHLRCAQVSDKNTHLLNWLRQLLDDGLIPEFCILEEVEQAQDWQERERYWIAHGLDRGWPLTNMTEGGEGIVSPSDELCRQRSRWMTGKRNAIGKRSVEFRRKKAIAAKGNHNALGHKVSDLSRKGISKNLKEYYFNGGEAVRGEENGQSKMTADQVRELRKKYASGGVSMRGLANDYPITYSTVRNIIHRKYWRHIE